MSTSLKDVQGAGPEGSDTLTTDQLSALGFLSPFSPTRPDPNPIGEKG